MREESPRFWVWWGGEWSACWLSFPCVLLIGAASPWGRRQRPRRGRGETGGEHRGVTAGVSPVRNTAAQVSWARLCRKPAPAGATRCRCGTAAPTHRPAKRPEVRAAPMGNTERKLADHHRFPTTAQGLIHRPGAMPARRHRRGAANQVLAGGPPCGGGLGNSPPGADKGCAGMAAPVPAGDESHDEPGAARRRRMPAWPRVMMITLM